MTHPALRCATQGSYLQETLAMPFRCDTPLRVKKRWLGGIHPRHVAGRAPPLARRADRYGSATRCDRDVCDKPALRAIVQDAACRRKRHSRRRRELHWQRSRQLALPTPNSQRLSRELPIGTIRPATKRGPPAPVRRTFPETQRGRSRRGPLHRRGAAQSGGDKACAGAPGTALRRPCRFAYTMARPRAPALSSSYRSSRSDSLPSEC